MGPTNQFRIQNWFSLFSASPLYKIEEHYFIRIFAKTKLQTVIKAIKWLYRNEYISIDKIRLMTYDSGGRLREFSEISMGLALWWSSA